MYPEKIRFQKKTFTTPMFIVTLLARVKIRKSLMLSTEEWLKKVCGVVHVYHSAKKKKKKEQNLIICRYVDGPRYYHRE